MLTNPRPGPFLAESRSNPRPSQTRADRSSEKRLIHITGRSLGARVGMSSRSSPVNGGASGCAVSSGASWSKFGTSPSGGRLMSGLSLGSCSCAPVRIPFLNRRMSSRAYIVMRRASLWCSAGVVIGVSKPLIFSPARGSSDASLGFVGSSSLSCPFRSTSSSFGSLSISSSRRLGQQGEYRALASKPVWT
jgi:hypothetical protein